MITPRHLNYAVRSDIDLHKMLCRVVLAPCGPNSYVCAMYMGDFVVGASSIDLLVR